MLLWLVLTNDEDVDFCDNIEIGLLTCTLNSDCVQVRTHEDGEASTVNLTPDEALRMADDLKALAISMGAKA